MYIYDIISLNSSYNKITLDNFVQKIKTRFLASQAFVRKSWRGWDEVERYGRDRKDTEGNITRHMPLACWINKATDTHSEYEILTVSHDNSDFAEVLQY